MAVDVKTHVVYALENLAPTKSYVMAVVFDKLARENKPISPAELSKEIKTKQLEDILDHLEDKGLVKLKVEEGQGIKTMQITENGLTVYEKLKQIEANVEEIEKIIE